MHLLQKNTLVVQFFKNGTCRYCCCYYACTSEIPHHNTREAARSDNRPHTVHEQIFNNSLHSRLTPSEGEVKVKCLFFSCIPLAFPIIWGSRKCIEYHSSTLSCPVLPPPLTPDFLLLFYMSLSTRCSVFLSVKHNTYQHLHVKICSIRYRVG